MRYTDKYLKEQLELLRLNSLKSHVKDDYTYMYTKKPDEKIKIIEILGGAGVYTQALKQLGIDYEIVDYVDNDKFACRFYNAINDTEFEPKGIKSWCTNSLKSIDVDLITLGSPLLNNYTIKGRRERINRSTPQWESITYISKVKPKFIIFNNDLNVINPPNNEVVKQYIRKLDDIGYISFYMPINLSNYGVPINQDYFYIVSIREDLNQKYWFPPREELKLKLKDYLEPSEDVAEEFDVSEKYYELMTTTNYVQHSYKQKVQDYNGVCRPFMPYDYDYKKCVVQDGRLRRLTPKEYLRLAGFCEEDIDKVMQSGKVSNKQMYRSACGASSVQVAKKIIRNLISDEEQLY